MKNLKSNNEYATIGQWTVILQVGNCIYDFHYYEHCEGKTPYDRALEKFKSECADASYTCALLTDEKRRISLFNENAQLFYKVDIKGTDCI